jgi:hypothetical protein
MRTALQLGVLLPLVVCTASGCQLLSEHEVAKGNSPLQAAQASPDSVGMQIIWARFPANDPVLDEAAWREIDETSIEPAVRRALADNGLRAGVIGSSLPPAVLRIVQQGEPPAEPAVDGISPETSELLTEPAVHGRTCRLRRNQRTEVQASEVYAALPLLVSGDRELSGHTYQQAQAIYALRVDPRPDRSVAVELTPEVHHGSARLRWTGGDNGILRQAPLRDREVFERLKVSVNLAPGEMLVLMSLPEAGSRLGHYFHTVDSADGPQQKLILIRLAEVPPSDTFAIAEP